MESYITVDFRKGWKVFDNSNEANVSLKNFLQKHKQLIEEQICPINQIKSWEQLYYDVKIANARPFFRASIGVRKFNKEYEKFSQSFRGVISSDGRFFQKQATGQLFEFVVPLKGNDLKEISVKHEAVAIAEPPVYNSDSSDEEVFVPSYEEYVKNKVLPKEKILEIDFTRTIPHICKPVTCEAKCIYDDRAYKAFFNKGFRGPKQKLYDKEKATKNLNRTMEKAIKYAKIDVKSISSVPNKKVSGKTNNSLKEVVKNLFKDH